MFIKVISTGSKAGNCYSLTADNGAIILLDFGCDKQKILRGIDYKISNICGALLSHGHGDHLKSYKWLTENGIQIYTNKETAGHFREVTKMIGLPEKTPFIMGAFTIIPFYVPHDGTPNFAYIITFPDGGKMLYATDFEYLPFTFKNMRLNYMLLECNHMDDAPERDSMKYEHSLRGHSSLSTVKRIVEVNKTPELRNIILCHLSDGWSDERAMQEEIKKVAGKHVEVSIASPGFQCGLKRYPF